MDRKEKTLLAASEFSKALTGQTGATAVVLRMGEILAQRRPSLQCLRLCEYQNRVITRASDQSCFPTDAVDFRVKITVEKYFLVEVLVAHEYAIEGGLAAYVRKVLPEASDEEIDAHMYGRLLRLFDIFIIVLSSVVENRVFISRHLLRQGRDAPTGNRPKLAFNVSCRDGTSESDHVTLSRIKGARNILIPDFYFERSEGYADHKEFVLMEAPAWESRKAQAIWRGSSTGLLFSIAEPLKNMRMQLAVLTANRPDLFNFKITHICNCPVEERTAVQSFLEAHDAFGPGLPMRSFADYKFALHLDGNTSAAGFFEKFSLGCCVLRVGSDFEQWFEPDITPWVHYVPIAADLSDLKDKLGFMLANDDLAKSIAQNGFTFACNRTVQSEGQKFCEQIVMKASQEPRICRFLAPIEAELSRDPGDPARSQWHGVEINPSGPFRWTATPLILWPMPADLIEGERVQIQIPLFGAVVEAMISASKILVDDTELITTVVGRSLVAVYVVGPTRPSTVALRTPPLRSPIELWPGNKDQRNLGLAIPIR